MTLPDRVRDRLFRPPAACAVCSGTGWVSISFFGKRAAVCTCGAGSPSDEMILHDVACDSVRCPFDQLKEMRDSL